MIYLLIYLLVTAFIVLTPGKRTSFLFSGLLIMLMLTASSFMSITVFFDGNFLSQTDQITSGLIFIKAPDKLSAFFILVINFTVLTGFMYSIGYLPQYLVEKSMMWIKLHYLSLVWLHTSMIMVSIFRNGYNFLLAWELMTISSFILVIFNYEVKGTLKAGLNYLIQMHIGMLFIMAALFLSSSGYRTVSFDNLHYYFENNPNWPVFLLFFTGFGLKAGFFMLHTWLPDAHPAAPSHVSGIMSGVMIKVGIYGILRVTTFLLKDYEAIGISLIVISAVTGLFGVMMAILQHDVKKLLAYHSIENIGIIGLGIGLGIYGTGIGNPAVSAAGFAGAFFHTFNHSLFKSLLFYSSGSVISNLHTQNIEQMGGLMKFMPFTGWAFLVGAIAITGLPPLNGFISEFFIYSSLFNGIVQAEFNPVLVFFIGIFSMVLIGGLALLCFTKVFSVIFLGQPRTDFKRKPVEVEKVMLISKFLPVILIIAIGALPFLTVNPVLSLTGSVFPFTSSYNPEGLLIPLKFISIAAILLLFVLLSLIVLRRKLLSGKKVSIGPTWGCGYSAVDARQQYTATSFIQEYASLTKPVIKSGESWVPYQDEEIFPGPREFRTSSDDNIKINIINKPADYIVNISRKAAVFQTGKLQHYVFYLLVFLLSLMLLTIMKVI